MVKRYMFMNIQKLMDEKIGNSQDLLLNMKKFEEAIK